MTQNDALRLIKVLRDVINDDDADQAWVNRVCFHLDQAADVIEFPAAKEVAHD